MTSAYHLQSNGLTETFNQTLQITLIWLVNDKQNDWDKYLPAILFSYRTSIPKKKKKKKKITHAIRSNVLPICKLLFLLNVIINQQL